MRRERQIFSIFTKGMHKSNINDVINTIIAGGNCQSINSECFHDSNNGTIKLFIEVVDRVKFLSCLYIRKHIQNYAMLLFLR